MYAYHLWLRTAPNPPYSNGYVIALQSISCNDEFSAEYNTGLGITVGFTGLKVECGAEQYNTVECSVMPPVGLPGWTRRK